VITLSSSIVLGFFLGMRHATDADHVLAIATIVGREKRLGPAALVGALWGVGHTATVLGVGTVMILFGVVIPPSLTLALEFGVGVMLIVLGWHAVAGALRKEKVAFAPVAHPHGALGRPRTPPLPAHAHVHAHGDHVHTHRHGHGDKLHGHAENATPTAWLDRQLGRLGLYHALRPVLIGVVHGLAGSAAVALLALGAIRDPWWALAYLAVFGLGTVAGMMLITAALAVPFTLSAARVPRLNHLLRLGSGTLSLGFGAYLAGMILLVASGRLAS